MWTSVDSIDRNTNFEIVWTLTRISKFVLQSM